MECLIATVSFDLFLDNYFTSFRVFICLPTLELTTIEQGVCSTKTGYTKWGQTAAKKERDHFEQHSGYQAKMLCNLCGW